MPTLNKIYRYDGSSWVEVLDFDTFAKITQLSNYLPLAGGTLTGDLIINAPHRDTYYASNVCRFLYGGTSTEYVIKTKIKYVSGAHMPVVRIYGYAYGLQCPIELRLGFYIYHGNLGWCGAVSAGAWKPEIYLFKYTENSTDYVAVGFKGACYYCGFQVDVQIGAVGQFNSNISIDGWSTAHNGSDTSVSIIPSIGTDNCVQVPYRAMSTSISGSATSITDGTYTWTPSSLNTKFADYLPLSGGTLSATNIDILTVKRTTSASGAFIQYKNNNQDTYKWIAGMDLSNAFMFDYSSGSSWTTLLTLDTSGNLILNNSSRLRSRDTSGTSYDLLYVNNSNNIIFGNSSVWGGIYVSNNIIPLATNTYNLGCASVLWKNLYLSGNLSDGTNSISIANIASQSWVENKGYLTGITSAMVTTALGYTPPTADTNFYPSRSYSEGLQISTNNDAPYSACALYVPYASDSQFGVIKAGTGLSVASGVLSLANGICDDTTTQPAQDDLLTYNALTTLFSEKPTTTTLFSTETEVGTITGAGSTLTKSITLTTSVQAGDRLKVYFKGGSSYATYNACIVEFELFNPTSTSLGGAGSTMVYGASHGIICCYVQNQSGTTTSAININVYCLDASGYASASQLYVYKVERIK